MKMCRMSLWTWGHPGHEGRPGDSVWKRPEAGRPQGRGGWQAVPSRSCLGISSEAGLGSVLRLPRLPSPGTHRPRGLLQLFLLLQL